MKIAYIITLADQYGGAQIHVRDLSAWMKNNGHHPIVMAGTDGNIANDIRKNGIPFIQIPWLNRPIRPIHDLRAFFHLRRALKHHRPDIVSCHSSKVGIIGRLAASSLGIPVIFTAHGWSFSNGISWRKRFIFKYLEKLCARFCDHIITVCHFDKRLARTHTIAPDNHITAIHNGMPFMPPVSMRPHNNPVQMVMVARFSKQKDHKTLLHALSHIKTMPWHMNLIGGGDDRHYRKMAADLGIEDKITFHGQRGDVSDFLTRQDIFLLISHWEGFSRSIIEAMRASLPVIATHTAGAPESVSQSKSGYIVPEQCPRTLAAAMASFINNAPLRRRMGHFGRKKYERLFTFEGMAVKTMAIYKTVLATRLATQSDLPALDHRINGLPLSPPPSKTI